MSNNLGPAQNLADSLLLQKHELEVSLANPQQRMSNPHLVYLLLGTFYEMRGEYDQAQTWYQDSRQLFGRQQFSMHSPFIESEQPGLVQTILTEAPGRQVNFTRIPQPGIFMPSSQTRAEQSSQQEPRTRTQYNSTPRHYSEESRPTTFIQHQPTFYVVSPQLPSEPLRNLYRHDLPEQRVSDPLNNIYAAPSSQPRGLQLPEVTQTIATASGVPKPVRRFSSEDKRENTLLREIRDVLNELPKGESISRNMVIKRLGWASATLKKYLENLIQKGYISEWPNFTIKGQAYLNSILDNPHAFLLNEKDTESAESQPVKRKRLVEALMLRTATKSSSVSGEPIATEFIEELSPGKTLTFSAGHKRVRTTREDFIAIPSEPKNNDKPLDENEARRIRGEMRFSKILL
ncbi:MAG: hypothetical protein BGO43_05030 [Gammaproteobacteria bacterium 39-13]|nr:hypothetical protein [Gammaproteobacteria bacterium]OJV96214.1 MAG: hypothetical protein BGO43_05030 [Gammaproteobacteria bacterium 39-13]